MRQFLILGALLAAGACSDDNTAADDESYNCAAETRDDEFVLGLAKPGESSRFSSSALERKPVSTRMAGIFVARRT